jgi:predicted Co/Zn/Cd cation transporter (cation efflux family)
MYFFWITASQIYSGYQSKNDYSFCSMLPVTKKDIVKSKVISIYIIEGIHIVLGMIMGIVHNLIYGSFNIFFDINFAFFGVIIVMFSLFNVIFLPLYFKTAYYFGRPLIYGAIATLIYAFVFEYGVIKYEFMSNIFEGGFTAQMIVVITSIVITLVLNCIAMVQSRKNYESIV